MEENVNQFDQDLAIFLAEADKKLLRARKEFLALKKEPGNMEVINTLLRIFHNIKSSAFSLNLSNIRRVAHLIEDILMLVRDKDAVINANMLEIINDSIDYVDEVIITLDELHFEGRRNPIPIILKLKEFIDVVKAKKNQK